jgi:hypothetical protein
VPFVLAAARAGAASKRTTWRIIDPSPTAIFDPQKPRLQSDTMARLSRLDTNTNIMPTLVRRL